jgi:hypothetical protein
LRLVPGRQRSAGPRSAGRRRSWRCCADWSAATWRRAGRWSAVGSRGSSYGVGCALCPQRRLCLGRALAIR